MRRARSGFTLLEVLAAVAILGVLYTVLMGVAMQGRQAEGLSRRRLEASLIADRQMAELELQMNGGTIPAIGEEEFDADPYRILLRVDPFELLIPGLEDERGELSPILSELTADGTSPLRVIQVIVSWLEAGVEHRVIRTTYGFDGTTLDPTQLPQQAPPGGQQTPPGGREEEAG